MRVLGLTGRAVVIQKVSFRNYKAYRSLDLELEPFTVLVGPNASGKTTLLEGMLLATKGVEHGVTSELRQSCSHGLAGPVELSFSGVWGGLPGAVRIHGSVTSSPVQQQQWTSTIEIDWRGGTYKGRYTEGNGSSDVMPVDFCSVLRTTKVLRFDSRRLAEPAYSNEEIPAVESDGRGLAAVLAHLKLSDEDSFKAIEGGLRDIVPAVRHIRIERASVEQVIPSWNDQMQQVLQRRSIWGHKIVLDMKGAKGVPVTAVGEGTLMALGLLTVLMVPSNPRLVLLDDIELALHPSAQGKLIEVLRRIQEWDPELQLIATSHSPFILNYLDPKEVRMTFLAENGFARCEKLTAHPDFERWKDLMSPGEFWSTVGENWLAKSGEAHE